MYYRPWEVELDLAKYIIVPDTEYDKLYVEFCKIAPKKDKRANGASFMMDWDGVPASEALVERKFARKFRNWRKKQKGLFKYDSNK